MHVEDLLRRRADRLHDVGTEGDVGDEMPVHHVEMDPVGAGGVDGADFLTQFGEIRGQDRGRDKQRAGHEFLETCFA